MSIVEEWYNNVYTLENNKLKILRQEVLNRSNVTINQVADTTVLITFNKTGNKYIVFNNNIDNFILCISKNEKATKNEIQLTLGKSFEIKDYLKTLQFNYSVSNWVKNYTAVDELVEDFNNICINCTTYIKKFIETDYIWAIEV